MGVGRDEIELEAGDFLFFPPGQDHALLDASADLDLFVFALHPELADRAFGTRVFRSGRGRRLPSHELITWSTRLIGLTHVADAHAFELELVSLFSSAEEHLQAGHATSRRALERIVAAPDLSAAELSRTLGSSRSELSRRVHHDWGVPLVELRARTKLMRFIRAVDAGTEFTRAALDSDFGSYAQCHRVFQRVLRCSPSEYVRYAKKAEPGV